MHPGEEKEVFITWSPIHNGYFRKTVRIHDVTKKARSFDVVLRGMAVTSDKSKKLKVSNKINPVPELKNLDSTVTLTKKLNLKNLEISHDIRRQTYTIDEKENFIPDNTGGTKNLSRASSPVSGKNIDDLNMFRETSTSSQCFSSSDSVEGIFKYSKFVFDLGSDESKYDERNSLTRRSTVACENPEKLQNIYTSNENALERGKFSYLQSFDEVKETQSEVRDYFRMSGFSRNEKENNSLENICVPNKDYLSDSLECISLSEPETKNVTFNTDVFLTPHKNWNLDSLIISPVKSENSPSPICVDNFDHSKTTLSSRSCKRKDLIFISPPSKSKRSRKHSEDLYPYRTGNFVEILM